MQMKKRQKRLTAIADILLNNIVGSQDELLELLQQGGYDVTQATLSRDLKTLRTSKIPTEMGRYRYVMGGVLPPDKDVEPGDRNGTNPDHKTWEEIKNQYDFESVPFNDGEPDFFEVAKGEVEISDFTDDRDANFSQADEELARQRGCTPEEVDEWRGANRYTWHECRDCRTMQKVPTEVHGNISHSGGVSEYKLQQRTV